MRNTHCALAVAAALALSGCGLTGPARQVPDGAPAQWQAPLPHGGNVTELSGWWRSQGDPVLAQLIEAAQEVSPTIASARSRIGQARAERTAAGAALAPAVNGVATSTRTSQQQAETPSNTTSQVYAQATWEVDLFGGNRAARDAAQARLESAQAGWHDARVSVAAETANEYYGLRACQQLLAVAQQDAKSRADTARLTQVTSKAGFQAPATAAQARASAAEANSRAIAQRAQCDVNVKALVALTAIDEPQLRERLAGAPSPDDLGSLSPAQGIALAQLPAQTLAQRPDVFTAEREVAAASFEVAGARAQRFPRLTLAGAVGRGRVHVAGENVTANTWNIGPVQMTLPLFDAGTRRANVAAAQERYEAAVASYRGTVRQAVREVEEALVNLQSADERAEDVRISVEGYQSAFVATEDRYKNGMASLLELEDARRTRLAAENALVSLQRERSAAWIALYRAAGGGWTRRAQQ